METNCVFKFWVYNFKLIKECSKKQLNPGFNFRKVFRSQFVQQEQTVLDHPLIIASLSILSYPNLKNKLNFENAKCRPIYKKNPTN